MYLIYVIIFLVLILSLYLFSIKPNKKRDLNFPLEVYYSHRGIHDNKDKSPENSMLAFEMAVKEGFGIELDVQVTQDNLPVIFHDAKLKRVCGVKGKIKDFTFKELEDFKLFHTDQSIPSFEKVLDLVDGRVPLIIEIKNYSNDTSELKYIAKILDNYRGAYVIESFNPLVLIWYKKNRPQIIRGQLSTYYKKNHHSFTKNFRDFILENFMMNFLAKPDFIAFNYKYKNMFSFKLCKTLYNPITAAYTFKSQESLNANLNDFDLLIFDSFIPKKDTIVD